MRSRKPPAEGRAPGRYLLALGVPLLIGSSAELLSSAVDVAMIGHYDRTHLAAVAAASVLFDIFVNIVIAACVGYQILAPRYLALGDRDELGRVTRHSVALAGAVLLVAAVVTVGFGRDVVATITGGDAAVAGLGQDYLLWRAPELVLAVPFALLGTWFASRERTRVVMRAGLIVAGANVLLDLILIYGPGPLPAFGAAGSGAASSIAFALAVAYLMVARLSEQPAAQQLVEEASGEIETSVFKLSWPAMVSMTVDYLGIALFFVVIGRLGADAVAGARIAAEYEAVAFVLFAALSAGVRISASRTLATEGAAAVRAWHRAGLRLMLAIAGVATLVFVAVPDLVTSVMSTFPAVLDAADGPMILVGLSLLPMAACIVNIAVMRSFGLTRREMVLTVGTVFAVQLPVAWVFAVPLGYGVTGAFAGVLAYWTVRWAVSLILVEAAIRHAENKPSEPVAMGEVR